jgi:predicted nucleotide-binding protein
MKDTRRARADGILDVLEAQLLKIREPILRDAGRNIHWRIAEALNLIRDQLLEGLEVEEREMWARLAQPMDVERPEGGGPYTASADDGLRLCDQMLSITQRSIAKPQAETPHAREALSRVVPLTSNVFLIHGHDAPNALRLRTLLTERFQVNPVILSERPGMGRVLLEKFEEEAGICSFAFAILTADDLVGLTNDSYRQARPNVLFELGWFYGRLGRRHVCILHQVGTSIPSDLEGIARIVFRESVEEVLGEIDRELRAAQSSDEPERRLATSA